MIFVNGPESVSLIDGHYYCLIALAFIDEEDNAARPARPGGPKANSNCVENKRKIQIF